MVGTWHYLEQESNLLNVQRRSKCWSIFSFATLRLRVRPSVLVCMKAVTRGPREIAESQIL